MIAAFSVCGTPDNKVTPGLGGWVYGKSVQMPSERGELLQGGSVAENKENDSGANKQREDGMVREGRRFSFFANFELGARERGAERASMWGVRGGGGVWGGGGAGPNLSGGSGRG